MSPVSLRAMFLIAVGSAVFHLSLRQTIMVLLGYWICAHIDRWMAKREIDKIIDDEIFGWERDREDSEYETKGNLSRIKLTGQNQIIAARIAEVLRRIGA